MHSPSTLKEIQHGTRHSKCLNRQSSGLFVMRPRRPGLDRPHHPRNPQCLLTRTPVLSTYMGADPTYIVVY